MKKIILPAILFIIALFVICLGFLVRSGLFAEIKITKEKVEPIMFAYNVSIGPYKKTAAVMDRIYDTLLGEKGVPTTRGFGLYFDKPGTVPDEKLRSIAGCIIEKEHQSKLLAPSKKFGTGIIPETNAIVARFPYKGKLSIILGVSKVYPELEKYLAANKINSGPVMEIYDSEKSIISYIIPEIDSKLLEEFLKPAQ